MAERCNSCGAELFAGQQFCRACGTPTRQISSEELPTQMLPHQQPPQSQQPDAPPPPLNTSRLPGRDTSDPVHGAGFNPYQPSLTQPQQRPTSPVGALPPPPPRRRSRAWLYAALVLLVFFAGASVVAGLFFLNRPTTRVVKVTRPKVLTPVPPVPPLPPLKAGDEMLPQDEGAEVSGEQTVVTQTYPLAKDGSFELHNVNGDITIEGWDEQEAEVKIVKRGGSEAERANLKIMREQSANRLFFNTPPGKHAGVDEVRYAVKLPRNLRELELVSLNSNVVLVNVNTAAISINVQRGNIKLEDVSGTVNSRTTKGNTTVVLSEAARDAPQVFNVTHGNIELELAPGTNAELKADIVDGDIEIDEDMRIKVEQRVSGQQAVGRLGKGGQPIVVKVVSGNIKIHY